MREALAKGMTLSDASAYNFQFQETDLVLIDILSFTRYREGEYWKGHRQFCEQFGVPFYDWFHGNIEGIEIEKLSRLLPWWRKWNWNIFSHIVAPARLNRMSKKTRRNSRSFMKQHRSPQTSFKGILNRLDRWIDGIEPAVFGRGPERRVVVWFRRKNA